MSQQVPNDLTPRQRFLRAARCEPVDRPPVWLMRQAGRYLPEYQALRRQQSFMEAVKSPEIAAELTCQPIRRFGMDAAVIFCDILSPLEGFGLEVDFPEGVGPTIGPAVRTRADVERLSAFDPEEKTGYLAEAIRRVRAELGEDRAIVGFCGAPFTTASYLIEGRSSRNYENTKRMMYGDPPLFAELMERLVDALIPYLGMQVEAGADVIQLFDSWGGALDAPTWHDVMGPPVQRLVCSVKALGVPVTLYVNGCAHMLEPMLDVGASVLGVDWRVQPQTARAVVRGRAAVQGNLDPTIFFAGPEVTRVRTEQMLDAFGSEPGFIANVGSGLLPGTPVDSVTAFVETVKARGPGV